MSTEIADLPTFTLGILFSSSRDASSRPGPKGGVRPAKGGIGNKTLLGDRSASPQKEAGPAGARQGAPTRNQTDWRLKKQRPPIPWKPKRLMVFARDALGFGPGNAAHFSLTLAYLAQSEGGQV